MVVCVVNQRGTSGAQDVFVVGRQGVLCAVPDVSVVTLRSVLQEALVATGGYIQVWAPVSVEHQLAGISVAPATGQPSPSPLNRLRFVDRRTVDLSVLTPTNVQGMCGKYITWQWKPHFQRMFHAHDQCRETLAWAMAQVKGLGRAYICVIGVLRTTEATVTCVAAESTVDFPRQLVSMAVAPLTDAFYDMVVHAAAHCDRVYLLLRGMCGHDGCGEVHEDEQERVLDDVRAIVSQDTLTCVPATRVPECWQGAADEPISLPAGAVLPVRHAAAYGSCLHAIMRFRPEHLAEDDAEEDEEDDLPVGFPGEEDADWDSSDEEGSTVLDGGGAKRRRPK